ncbi:hypothetical protein CAEBREN_00785 [Caenorhabditis brenneri]|uniref:PAN-3 domain-containing protein n=1 Tax=Caenorhabditis brenneri TaxID=135651 RepID=G0NPC9_CAEBE|nr:hypothetical protein CAEBREN_00785 [Caenorhabditis brenneri]
MRLPLILLIFLLPQVHSLIKMAKIFGKVENPPSPKSSSLTTMELCFKRCYDEDDCFLVEFHSGECVYYYFSLVETSLKVVETEPESLMYVAFKTILPEDTCPVSFEAITLTYVNPDGTAYPWKVLSDGFSFPKCRYGWKLFERADKNVCIKLFKAATEITKIQAENNCEGFNSLLIGVETFEEANWMWDELSAVSDGSAFWLDGVRTESCRPLTPTLQDKSPRCNVFDWSNELTTGSSLFSSGDKSLELSYFADDYYEDCLLIATYKKTDMRIVYDVSCTNYPFSTGMVCGYKLD